MNLNNLPFAPHPLIKGPIAQTLAGSRFSGKSFSPERTLHKLKIDSQNQLMVFEIKPEQNTGPLVLMAHGMGGCSESAYMKRISGKLFARGYGVFLMNQRGSGAGMGLCDRLWNGGSSDDLDRVVNYISNLYPQRPILLIGFSLSGNILLKYLGEGRKIPAGVYAALAVNPPIDLKISSKMISEGPWADTFNGYFLEMMNRQVEALVECFGRAYRPARPAKTIYEFDVLYTAPAFEFADVDEYYSQSSAKQFLETIRVPTTILCSKDDPFVPKGVFRGSRMSLCVDYLNPDFGGHMGYISKNKNPLGDRRWMDFICVRWAQEVCKGHEVEVHPLEQKAF